MLPTPKARDWKGGMGTDPKRQTHDLDKIVQLLPTPSSGGEEDAVAMSGGSLNPDWVEQHLMGLPEGWTRLEPLPDGAYDEWSDAMKDGTWWQEERGLPRVTTGVENRVNRLKMLGNGIVPATLALFLTDD